jgi:transcriptional regulator with XRE-family HTH domain
VSASFLSDFGSAVRRLRERRGMTQADLAERVGLGRTSMTNLESGKQNPPLSLLPTLARALGVDPERLIRETALPAEGDDIFLASQVHDDQLRRWASQVIANSADVSETSAPRSGQVSP